MACTTAYRTSVCSAESCTRCPPAPTLFDADGQPPACEGNNHASAAGSAERCIAVSRPSSDATQRADRRLGPSTQDQRTQCAACTEQHVCAGTQASTAYACLGTGARASLLTGCATRMRAVGLARPVAWKTRPSRVHVHIGPSLDTSIAGPFVMEYEGINSESPC